MKNIALILASGTGSRFGQDIPKQFYKISGKTILQLSIEAFDNNKFIDEIIIVSNPDFMDLSEKIVNAISSKKISKIISGGKTRQESSYLGVSAINDTNINVLIHDAVRPFVSDKIITDCILALDKYKAVNTAIFSSDTIIKVDENNIIKAVPDRNTIRRCQTPQGFDINIIKKAHEYAIKDNYTAATDDCTLVLKYNLADIFVIEG